jgi:thiol-disulfide isomerase/thioredoxin
MENMMKTYYSIALCLILAISTWAQEPEAVQRPALRVGMAAPELRVLKWIKGKPVTRFEAGRVYVVEGWATWCGPCKASIPHLTDLAKKHADKVTVIGVSVSERPKEKTNKAILAMVRPFVEEMGDKMNYHVAVDDIKQTMANAWLRAAGINTIPNAFIVGKDSRIAWLGHPMEMDKVLDAVLAGTFDVAAEALRQDKAWQEEQELKKLTAPIGAAFEAKDYKALLEAIDKALAAKPDMEGVLMHAKFNALTRSDETAAWAYLKVCLDRGTFKTRPITAYNSALIVIQNGDLKTPDYPLLAQVLEQAMTADGDHGLHLLLVVYAQVLAKDGKLDQAIKAQQKAIATAEPLVGTKGVTQAWLDTQKKAMAEYQAQKQQKP